MPEPTRDFAAELLAIIEAETQEPYTPRDVAARIVAKLRILDPALLAGYADLRVEDMVYADVDRRARAHRTHLRRLARNRTFVDAARQHEAGDASGLRRFLDMPLTVESGHRKRLADLTATDLHYVADTYAERASHNLMMAAFLRVLAKQLTGSDVVADHYDNGQLAWVYWQIQAGEAEPAP